MIHYLDTSSCVAALTPEQGSERTAAWLAAQPEGTLAISAWCDVEVSSALSLKVRTGALTAAQRTRVQESWTAVREGLHRLPVGESAFAAAAGMLARHDLGLRAGDALHLAVAAAHGCTLVTLDERLAKAAPELGVAVTEF